MPSWDHSSDSELLVPGVRAGTGSRDLGLWSALPGAGQGDQADSLGLGQAGAQSAGGSGLPFFLVVRSAAIPPHYNKH